MQVQPVVGFGQGGEQRRQRRPGGLDVPGDDSQPEAPEALRVTQCATPREQLFHMTGDLLPGLRADHEYQQPLTDREQEVLGLMAERLTYNEIASRILVSLNTVRTHVKNIYGKLGVHKRSQAIARARELDLL